MMVFFRRWKLILATMASALLMTSSSAETPYRKSAFGKFGGYSDKNLGAGRWLVAAVASSDFSSNMALYRGAILAKAGKFQYIQTVKFQIENLFFSGTLIQLTKLTLVGTDDPNKPFECVAKEFFKPNCGVFSTDKLISELGPKLNQTPEDAVREVAEAAADKTHARHGY